MISIPFFSIARKAQLTPFVILGIVIISVFGFVFFATSEVQREQSQEQADKIFADIVQTTALRFYVNLCTEKALRSGIDILSKQGGKIFPSQSGSILKTNEKLFFQKEGNTTYFVAYGVLKSDIPSPQYPCSPGFANYDVPPAFCVYRSTNQKFNNLDLGINNMPSLCKDRFAGCSVDEGWNPRFSVQAELEAHISAYVKDCVDFESIVGINDTFAVSEGDVSTNVSFSDEDITAVVNFPIVISPQGSQPVIRFVSFESTLATRFKLLYGLIRDTVVRDVSSPAAASFEIKDGFIQLAERKLGLDHGFIITKRENVSFYDDFVEVIDTQADPSIGLKFQFLIENRPPVLNYIDPFGPYGKEPPAGCGIYDLIAIEGQPLTIIPSWFDTEEDSVRVYYSGWLQEYNETNVVPSTTEGCPIPTSGRKLFTLSSQSRWVKDSSFEQNGRVSAITTESDAGPHEFTIQVCDAQYCDNETIRVLIDDLIKVSVDKKNAYGSSTFSLEDPYSFSAKIQDIYNPGNYKFSWKVFNALDQEIYNDDSGEQSLELPFGNYDIVTISNIFKNHVPLFIAGNKYTISGSVVQQGQFEVSNKTDIVPQQCVSFVNANPPFPYNKTDPYLSNHACCNTDNTVKTAAQSATCFTETTYGGFKSFNVAAYITPYDSRTDKIGTPQNLKSYVGFSSSLGADPIAALKASGVVVDNSNDVIRRTFERKCDGTRGNICVGNFVETFTVVDDCTDKNSGEIASCFGPYPLETIKSGGAATTQPQCRYYDKTTLEKELGIPGFTTQCSGTPKCVTNQNSATGFSDIFIQQDITAGLDARYLCNATCGPNGCTQTIPTLCKNCYEDQKCIGPSAPTPDEENTLQLHRFDACSVSSNPQCQLQLTTVVDVCKTNANDEVVVDYVCKPSSEWSTTDTLYNVNEINCPILHEIDATETDGGDVVATAGSCTAQEKSLCQLNKCNSALTTSTISDQPKKFIDDPNPQLRKYVYREVYARNIWGSSKKESCDFKDYDYDALNPSFCSDAGFEWKNGRCCGDDIFTDASDAQCA